MGSVNNYIILFANTNLTNPTNKDNNIYVDDELYYFEVLLKVYFQDTSKRYQPLFENKAILMDCHLHRIIRGIRGIRG